MSLKEHLEQGTEETILKRIQEMKVKEVKFAEEAFELFKK